MVQRLSSQRMVLMSRLLVGSSSSKMSRLENSAPAPRSFQLGPLRSSGQSVVHRNAHAHQQLAGARLGGVAVVFGKLAFQVWPRVVFGGFQVGVNASRLAHRPHLDMTLQHPSMTLFFVGRLILAQLAQAQTVSMDTVPWVGLRSPRIFMKVDLPQPLAPIRP